MGNLTLNALAITVISALGLWVFYRSARIEKKRTEEERKKRDHPKQD